MCAVHGEGAACPTGCQEQVLTAGLLKIPKEAQGPCGRKRKVQNGGGHWVQGLKAVRTGGMVRVSRRPIMVPRDGGTVVLAARRQQAAMAPWLQRCPYSARIRW